MHFKFYMKCNHTISHPALNIIRFTCNNFFLREFVITSTQLHMQKANIYVVCYQANFQTNYLFRFSPILSMKDQCFSLLKSCQEIIYLRKIEWKLKKDFLKEKSFASVSWFRKKIVFSSLDRKFKKFRFSFNWEQLPEQGKFQFC